MTNQMNMKRTNRDAVCKALAGYYINKFAKSTGLPVEQFSGKIWVSWDESKRAYQLRGEAIPAKPDLQSTYPNGWSMLDWVKPSKARELVGMTAAGDAVSPKSRKIITEVRLIRAVDESPDTSWLGEYSSTPKGDFRIDRAHTLDCLYNFGEVADETLCAYCDRPRSEHVTIWLETVPRLVCPREETEDDDSTVDEFEPIACTCGERGDMERNEYRYFNPGSVDTFDLAASWIPATVIGEDARREYWRRTMQDNARKDYERMQAGSRGDYCYLYIRAEADIILGGKVTSQTGLIQTLTSGGLGGVESDAGDDYMADIEREELGTLRGQLGELGFSKRAVAAAFRDIKRKEDC